MGAAGGVLRPTPLARGALIVRFGSRDVPAGSALKLWRSRGPKHIDRFWKLNGRGQSVTLRSIWLTGGDPEKPRGFIVLLQHFRAFDN